MANSQTFTLNIKALFDASDVKAKVGDIQRAFSNIKMPDKLQKDFNASFSGLQKALTDFETRTAKGVNSKADAKGMSQSIDAVVREFNKVIQVADKVKAELGDTVDLSKIIKLDKSDADALKTLKDNAEQLKKEIASFDASKITKIQAAFDQMSKGKMSEKVNSAIDDFKAGKVDEAIQQLSELEQQYEALAKTKNKLFQKNNADGSLTTFGANLEQLKAVKAAMEEASPKVKELQDNYKQQGQVAQSAFNKLKTSIGGCTTELNDYSKAAQNAQQPIKDLTNNQAQFVREIDQIKSRIQYFFGLSNAINLVKRAIRGAVDTIKELDKAMTETAVVTDFSVGDMWEQLPEYTKRANELGVSTLAAYEAATLYYQQGLKTEEVNALSVETLKMARIAGLEAAEATDRMTNALRGFNMELTEVNAQRVDDVYSELAANTASNVDEISTAMTKVASLAHNANMEFETTAAFLSQIIETTRESAETAGTALKTVVARFSEVKKLIDTNQLQGQDEEGQIVDVNRVGQALRTAGIDLNKYFLGEVGLDDIFMELASKWDSLTSVQQRYIATQAAGSRQQSRFIALMSDYARTQELVGKAYNAEGASAKQFAKTQESLESKLARLKNAWNEFLMGLTNNEVVKGFVDLLTNLLNTINNLTSAFGKGAGAAAKWGVVLAGLLGGKALMRSGGLVDNLIGNLAGNTVFGKILGKAGIGGAATGVQGAAPAKNVTWGQGQFIASAAPFQLFKKLKESRALRAEEFDTLPIGQMLGNEAGALGKFGAKVSSSKLLGGISKKLAKTEAMGGLAKILGFGTSAGGGAAAGGAGAAAAAGLATALGAVAVAVGAVVAGYQLWLHLTPEGQLKQATQIAEVLNQVSANAEKVAISMKQASESYKEFNDAVSHAKSADEYEQAILKRNDYITDQLQQNADLAQYVTSELVNGEIVLSFNTDKLEEGLAKAEEGANQAAISAHFTNAVKSDKQAEVLLSKYRAAGVDLQNRKVGRYTELSEGLEMSNADYAKYSNMANDIAKAQAESFAEVKQGFLKGISELGLEDEVANTIATAMASNFDSQKYYDTIAEKRRKNWANSEATNKKLREKYRDLYGVEADSSMKRKELAIAVATGETTKDQQTHAETLNTLIKGQSGSLYKDLLNTLAGQGEAFQNFKTEDDIKNYVEEIASQIHDPRNLGRVAEALGIDYNGTADLKKQLANQIKEQRKQAQENANQQRKIMYETLLQAGLGQVSIDQQEKINNLTPEQAEALSNTVNNALEVIKPEEFANLLPDLVSQIGTSTFDEISALLGKINLDDPIIAFNQLKEAEQGATSEVQQYIDAIRRSNSELFTNSNLVQSFIASADYDGLTKQMDKLIKKNEHLTAKNIEELAEECDALNSLLETGAANAQTLAEAFTLVQQGKLAFDQITDSILKALEAGTSFEELVDRVGDWISEFDKGTDLKEGTKHIIDSLKDLKEYVENWEFGNEPTKNIYEHIFGKDSYKDLLKKYGKDFKGLEKEITQRIDQVSKWAENEGLGGIQEASTKIDKLKEVEGSGGQFFEWDLSEFQTTDEAIKAVADALKVTDEAALAFIESWKVHIPGLGEAWDNLDYDTKLDAFAKNLGDLTAITEEQLAALGALVGKTTEEVAADLEKIFATNGQEIDIPINVQWKIDGKDKAGTDLENELKKLKDFENYKQYGNKIAEERTIYHEGKSGKRQKTIDYDTEDDKLKRAGLSEAQRKESLKNMAKEANVLLSKEIEIPIEAKDGSIEMVKETITGNSAEALEAGIKAAQEKADYSILASKLAGVDTSGFQNKIFNAVWNGAKNAWDAWQPTAKDVTINTHLGIFGRASGGLVGSYAKGTEYLQPGFALTGEEGPEIVWNKEQGYAYVTGQNGAEFQDLQPGDRIFNAAETQRIFRNSSLANGGYIPSYSGGKTAEGGWKKKKESGSGGGSGSESGSGKDKDDEWRNDLDWLYNVMENIAELERQQNIYQEEYEDLLKDQTKTGQDLYKMLIKQLGNLYTQLDHQTYTLERREQEMREFMDTTNDQDEYLWYNWEDRTIEIDWDAIDKITDQEKYDHIKDLISEAEEIQDKMDDAEDAIIDVENQIQELENIWRDTFIEFEERVLDAIVKMYQTVIDNYSELNDTLNESNQQILDSINKEISLQRQIRDNTKTEQEIADNEAKLAYMQRDTTGGNDLAALQMGKELEDQRESYSDNLIDQAIQRLQDDNDAAAQQREKQIEIMQAQLDYQAENGEFNAYLRDLLDTAVDTDGHLATDSALYRLLAEQDNIDAMTEVEREVWEEELNTTFNQVMAELLKRQGEAEGSYFTAVTAAFNGISDTFDKAFHGSYSQGGAHGSKSSSSGGGNKPPSSVRVKDKVKVEDDDKVVQEEVKSTIKPTKKDIFKGRQIEERTSSSSLVPSFNTMLKKIKSTATNRNSKAKYATGGLNTQTGLAWLDGTPSEPEYVLNARQTDAFLKLADVLPTVMSPQNSGNSTVFGDTTNNIVINVDRIDSDYSVDQMVDRVKEKLFETGSYRNNNVLSLLR